ncbi:MAG TPA: hypothetical protein VIM28_05525 [Solirubrobacterales bacterium]
MPDRPQAPATALITWIAIVADAIAIVLLLRSNQPTIVKAVAGGLDALGIYTIFVFYLGRRWEWRRLSGHFRKVDRRNALEPATVPHPSAGTKRRAASSGAA